MSQFRPAPGIARGPQQFSRSQMPPIASPLGPPPLVPPESAISEQMQDLAMEIYARLAVEHIAAMGAKHDLAALRELAKASQAAAMAYFQELGVQFQEQNTNG